MLPVFYTLYQDPEPWESESRGHDGRPFADNIRNAWDYLKSNDLSASPMFLDVQGDRSDPDSVADTPMLRQSRLLLCDLTARAVQLCLQLLGIQTVERM